MHAPLERRVDRPAGVPGGVAPVAVGDEHAAVRDPATLRECARDEVVERVRLDLRLAAVRRVEHDATDGVVAERESRRVPAHRGPVAGFGEPRDASVRAAVGVVVGSVEERGEVLARPPRHLRLRVDAEDVRADESRLDEDAAGPAHRVEDGRAGACAGEVRDCARQQRVHAPRLEERAVGRPPVAEVPDRRRGLPADRADARVPAGRASGHVAFLVDGLALGRERDAQHVVGVVEVDVEPAVDEHATEFPFGVARRHARGAPDVPRANRDRAFPSQGCGVEERARRRYRGVAGPDELARTPSVRQPADAPGDDCVSGRETDAEPRDARRRRRCLATRERVVLAAEFQQIHARPYLAAVQKPFDPRPRPRPRPPTGPLSSTP